MPDFIMSLKRSTVTSVSFTGFTFVNFPICHVIVPLLCSLLPSNNSNQKGRLTNRLPLPRITT